MADKKEAWYVIGAAVSIILGILLPFLPNRYGRLGAALAGAVAIVLLYLMAVPWHSIETGASQDAGLPPGSQIVIFEYGFGALLCGILLLAGIFLSARHFVRTMRSSRMVADPSEGASEQR